MYIYILIIYYVVYYVFFWHPFWRQIWPWCSTTFFCGPLRRRPSGSRNQVLQILLHLAPIDSIHLTLVSKKLGNGELPLGHRLIAWRQKGPWLAWFWGVPTPLVHRWVFFSVKGLNRGALLWTIRVRTDEEGVWSDRWLWQKHGVDGSAMDEKHVCGARSESCRHQHEAVVLLCSKCISTCIYFL